MVLLLKSDIKKEKRDTLLNSIKKLLGATKEKLTEFGEKKLAYPIKKNRTGNYLISEFESESSASKDLDQKLLINDDVLRYLLVRTK